jgi:uncharacterized membrane protein YoaK (UPF0700 family)
MGADPVNPELALLKEKVETLQKERDALKAQLEGKIAAKAAEIVAAEKKFSESQVAVEESRKRKVDLEAKAKSIQASVDEEKAKLEASQIDAMEKKLVGMDLRLKSSEAEKLLMAAEKEGFAFEKAQAELAVAEADLKAAEAAVKAQAEAKVKADAEAAEAANKLKAQQEKEAREESAGWFVSGFAEEETLPLFFTHKGCSFKREDLMVRKTLVHILMNWNAGFLNGTALSQDASGNIGITSVTGNASRMAVAFADGSIRDANIRGGAVSFFLIGAVLAGFFNFNHEERPGKRYGYLLLIPTVMMFMATILFAIGKNQYNDEEQFFFPALYLLSTSAGFQNAMMTCYSGHGYRVTHITGTMTDCGVVLARTISCGYYPDTKKLMLLVPPLIFFIIGVGCSLPAYKAIGHDILWINIAVLLVLCVLFSLKNPRNKKLAAALK